MFIASIWCLMIREPIDDYGIQVLLKLLVKLYVTSFNHLVKLQEESKCFSFKYSRNVLWLEVSITNNDSSGILSTGRSQSW